LLASVRAVSPGRIILVFGCGGDRDRGKRPLMGEVAARLADSVIITSDNPRTEEPDSIIDQIKDGISRLDADVQTEPDRAVAIASAISRAERGDIVVIAGKGHETTQEIAGTLHPFSDADVARSAMTGRKGSRT
jgi:UDP-N-acetylmuramoyl-L-alanyl-D-glutamate--2,6-diaminopimelate ligase